MWKDLAMDIFFTGYDRFREPMECKAREATKHGRLHCTKGLGRLSVIYFGALWTFLHKDEMSDSSKHDFCRPDQGTFLV